MWAWLRQPQRTPTPAELAAREAFAEVQPGREICWTTVAAEEEARTVVGVFYDWGGKPPAYRFFAVERESGLATPVQDDAPYRPKDWR
jgi:hypothetical protein